MNNEETVQLITLARKQVKYKEVAPTCQTCVHCEITKNGVDVLSDNYACVRNMPLISFKVNVLGICIHHKAPEPLV